MVFDRRIFLCIHNTRSSNRDDMDQETIPECSDFTSTTVPHQSSLQTDPFLSEYSN